VEIKTPHIKMVEMAKRNSAFPVSPPFGSLERPLAGSVAFAQECEKERRWGLVPREPQRELFVSLLTRPWRISAWRWSRAAKIAAWQCWGKLCSGALCLLG